MTIAHSRQNQELEDEGEDELVLTALRYTGHKSIYNATALRDHGLASLATLQGRPGDQPGPWIIALLPSRELGYFENHADIEVAYDRETIAAACLEKNQLPSPVFGDSVNPGVQDRVLDTLGIERLPRRAEAIREDLAEIAGTDVDPGEEAEAEEFPYDLTRSELWAVSKPFDPPYEWNEMRTTEAEEFLLEQDADAVRSVVHQVQNGAEDPTLDEEAAEDGGDA